RANQDYWHKIEELWKADERAANETVRADEKTPAKPTALSGYRYLYHANQLVAEVPLQINQTTTDGNTVRHTTAQADWENAIYWLYQEDDFTPTARYQNGQLHYTVADQIGTITELLTEDGYIDYRQKLNLWGEAEIDAHRHYAANDENPLSCNHRFVGQYYDEESELHYNRFRYYSPETGQYISHDPIGLLGGFNPYGYVDNPTAWVDPLGLAKCPVREVNGTKIYGTGQKDRTPGHDTLSELLANKLAMSGKFEKIYLNRAYNTGVGQGGTRRPDVMAIDHSGRVHSIEIASKTDMGSKLPTLTTRNSTSMNKLPAGQRGRIIVLEHPYKAADIKLQIDNLIKGIK
ncbi:RHS repeat-associated core domain-containing protein, partial [Pasteurellaceae bacterium LIM206]|nr:RHS repeat-associated core domain-containing protein [Pasteurellaceae bacterium LIM206]